jgi:hypothetical protein
MLYEIHLIWVIYILNGWFEHESVVITQYIHPRPSLVHIVFVISACLYLPRSTTAGVCVLDLGQILSAENMYHALCILVHRFLNIGYELLCFHSLVILVFHAITDLPCLLISISILLWSVTLQHNIPHASYIASDAWLLTFPVLPTVYKPV